MNSRFFYLSLPSAGIISTHQPPPCLALNYNFLKKLLSGAKYKNEQEKKHKSQTIT
jgi:hypothetical protein